MSADAIEKKLSDTVRFFSKDISQAPALAFILGSGLASFADLISVRKSWSFRDIPHFSSATVEGHPGRVIFGELEGVPVLAQQGRLHAYEGLDFSDVVFPMRTWAKLGIKKAVITNAAGGLSPKMKPGDFMVLKDQINLTGANPLRGENLASLGPRFVDMTEPFNKTLSKILADCLKSARARFTSGVYVGVMGPSYETAAEIQFFRKIGGGAVGMSTVAEVLAARHAGMDVVGLSCITNLGTGISKTKLDHADIKDVAQMVEAKFAKTLRQFTKTLKTKKLL